MDTHITENSGKSISYSQIMTYHTCPHRWYLTYVKNNRSVESNIHLLFGTSMHIVLQNYLYVMYNDSIANADKLDLDRMLLDELKTQFKKSKEESNLYPATKEQLFEFYDDGVKILNWVKTHKSKYFSKNDHKLIGCEIPLNITLFNNVSFRGFIDIVILNTKTNTILIKDFKTSTRGWSDFEKNDEIKIQQMVLYKKMYSDMYGVDINNIEIEYIILKRKLNENTDYIQGRIQRFSPPSGKITVNKVINNMNSFINECFDTNGEYIDKEYQKNVSDKACKFCQFNSSEILCDKNKKYAN